MKRAAPENINTANYWDSCYRQEETVGRARVDETRLLQILRWIRIREEELGRRASVLDVGCGLGDLARFLIPHHPDLYLTGIDLSPEAVNWCLRNISAQNMTWKLGSAEHLNVPDESHDLVWIGETLEHCEDPDRAVAEACRACGEGGFLILSTPYRGRNRSPEHVWEFDPSDVCRWAKSCGDLMFLDCALLPGFLTMFAVIRRAVKSEPS